MPASSLVLIFVNYIVDMSAVCLQCVKLVMGRASFSLSINHADVFSTGNYSCVPFNKVGMAQPAAASIRVHSPPSFVQSLEPISGMTAVCLLLIYILPNVRSTNGA